MITITKKELIKLGYGNSFATYIMRDAKMLMVHKGYIFYKSKKLDRVPKQAVEEILGITLPNDISSLQENQ